jgi:hypothetical protein
MRVPVELKAHDLADGIVSFGASIRGRRRRRSAPYRPTNSSHSPRTGRGSRFRRRRTASILGGSARSAALVIVSVVARHLLK